VAIKEIEKKDNFLSYSLVKKLTEENSIKTSFRI